jgi:hypothetical protein
MAFNVFFKIVENHTDPMYKGNPWQCDKCHVRDKVLLRIRVDYETLILCKKCLFECKKMITEREKELKDDTC